MRPVNRRFTTTSTVSPHCYRPEDLLPYHAVILASGKGSRLGALTTHKPKCLLPLGSETILDRQLRLLRDVGVSRITMVVGHQRDALATHLGGHVQTVFNSQYGTTSSISALWAARDSLSDDTLILNSDLVFERSVLESVTAPASPYVFAINSAPFRSGEVRMVIKEGRPTEIGRNVPVERSNAVFLGLGLVRSDGLAAFGEAVEHCAQRSLQTGWSKACLSLAADGYDVALCEYAGPWFDINSVATYRKACQFVASETRRQG